MHIIVSYCSFNLIEMWSAKISLIWFMNQPVFSTYYIRDLWKNSVVMMFCMLSLFIRHVIIMTFGYYYYTGTVYKCI